MVVSSWIVTFLLSVFIYIIPIVSFFYSSILLTAKMNKV